MLARLFVSVFTSYPPFNKYNTTYYTAHALGVSMADFAQKPYFFALFIAREDFYVEICRFGIGTVGVGLGQDLVRHDTA